MRFAGRGAAAMRGSAMLGASSAPVPLRPCRPQDDWQSLSRPLAFFQPPRREGIGKTSSRGRGLSAEVKSQSHAQPRRAVLPQPHSAVAQMDVLPALRVKRSRSRNEISAVESGEIDLLGEPVDPWSGDESLIFEGLAEWLFDVLTARPQLQPAERASLLEENVIKFFTTLSWTATEDLEGKDLAKWCVETLRLESARIPESTRRLLLERIVEFIFGEGPGSANECPAQCWVDLLRKIASVDTELAADERSMSPCLKQPELEGVDDKPRASMDARTSTSASDLARLSSLSCSSMCTRDSLDVGDFVWARSDKQPAPDGPHEPSGSDRAAGIGLQCSAGRVRGVACIRGTADKPSSKLSSMQFSSTRDHAGDLCRSDIQLVEATTSGLRCLLPGSAMKPARGRLLAPATRPPVN